MSEIALQNAVTDAATCSDPDASEDRVAISTIHRAKGLEWGDVYLPFFNEGFMPAAMHEEKSNRAERHAQGCAARGNAQCNKDCAAYFRQADSHDRGTPEERHADEERRLAHVAATRAKDRLTLLSIEQRAGKGAGGRGRGAGGRGRGAGNLWGPAENRAHRTWEPSSYESQLARLPADVFRSKVVQKED